MLIIRCAVVIFITCAWLTDKFNYDRLFDVNAESSARMYLLATLLWGQKLTSCKPFAALLQ